MSKLFALIVSAMLVAGAIAAGHAGAQASATKEILIGNVATTTNASARENGANLILGYSIHFQHVNGQGGVHGRSVRLVNRDDGLDPAKMIALAEEMIGNKEVLALAGFLNSLGVNEMVKSEMLAKNNIAMIAPVGPMNAKNIYPIRPGFNDEVTQLLVETRNAQKLRVGLAYFNQVYGPPVAKFAQDAAKKLGIDLVATVNFDVSADKMEEGIAAAVRALDAAKPDSVILVMGGNAAFNFVKRFRRTESGSAQLYALSPTDSFQLVKVAGLENARGIVISQAIPYPKHGALAVVREYQRAMKQYAPDKPLSFFGLEGFLGAKIAVEAIRRAGPNPTREKVIAALNGLGDFDLGDFRVNYSVQQRTGSKVVDLTIIGSDGALYR